MEESVFDEQKFRNAYPDDIEKNYWTYARNIIISRHLRSLGLSNSRILDVGAGRGVVVKQLRRLGFDCWGVESSSTVPPDEKCAHHLFIGLMAGDLPSEFRQTVDALILLDVLEHLENPREFLAGLLDEYPAVKHIVITVPARQELFSNYDDYYGHKKRFSLHDTSTLMEIADAGIRESRYLFHSLYPLAWLLIKLRGKRRIKLKAPSAMTSWMHWLAAMLLVLDDIIIPGRVYGTSILFSIEVSRQH